MRIAIIQFPGSNCERETMLAVKRVGMEPVEFLWNESREKLRTFDGYIIVGGFSYEDRSRAGIIAALDPVMLELRAQSAQGKPILGICNGAQILVETGLVPGLENNKVGVALTENKRMANGKILGTGYYNAWTHIRLADQYQRNAFTRHLTPKQILHVPVAHGEGRFVMTAVLLQEIKMQGLNVFQYCDQAGVIIDSFPVNPNGSLENIAALSNKAGNVLAIMPHPERTKNGDPIFQSMRDYIAEGCKQDTIPLGYYPRQTTASVYKPAEKAQQCIVELVITDNQALTVQETLQQHNIPACVTRRAHWEIHSKTDAAVTQVKSSGVLYNVRKETEVSVSEMQAPETVTFLVRAKDDLLGQQKLQTLRDHFSVQDVDHIKHGVLWQFSSDAANIAELTDHILRTNIIYNPYAHDIYYYYTA